MTTLLVEDEPEIRALIEQVLQMRGHEVAAFGDAEAAWAALQDGVPPLMILDWLLPGMDGLELCRRIRGLPGGARSEILVMTAHDRPDGLALALDAGASDYLLKPFGFDLLEVRLTIAERRAAAAAEHTRTDDALQQSEGHYRHLIDTSPDGIVVTDLTGMVNLANRRAAQLLGYGTPDALVGLGLADVLGPADLARAQKHLAKAVREDGVRNVVYWLRRRDGATFAAEISASVMRSVGGQPLGFLSVVRDITERRRMEQAVRTSEERQRALATLTRLVNSTLEVDAILPRLCQVVSGAGHASHASVFLQAGPETLRLAATTLGDRSPIEELGPLAAHVFAAGQAARERRGLYYNQVSAELGSVLAPPSEGLPAGERGESVLATPLLLANEVVGALALSSAEPGHFAGADLERAAEIAEIIGSALRNAQLYRREHEVTEQLRQMEHWRSAFLRLMAHEVRTPLGQISGFSDLLGGEAARLTERGQRYLSNVRAAATRLEVLVQRSFDLLRLYADQAPRDGVPVEVGQLVEMTIAAYRARAEAKGVSLQARGPAEPVEVEGDRQQLSQLLAVLLDNAVKFTPAGGAVEVAMQQHAGLVEVAVCDSGPGVPVDQRSALFGGGQGEDALTRQHGGMGLSLLMARRIAELHGGQLRLDVPEQGACFVVSLPVRGDAGQADHLTDPALMDLLEQRVRAALEGAALTVPSAHLGAQTGLPWRTLEALCYAEEEKGVLQVLQPAGSAGDEHAGNFVVLRVTLSAVTKALHPPSAPPAG